jgi:hypothetical protein
MRYVSPNEVLHALNDDPSARADFVGRLPKLIRGPYLRNVDGYLLTCLVFNKVTGEQTVEELQVDVAAKVFAAGAVDRVQRALDCGALQFRADFEEIELIADEWDDVVVERPLIGLSGWDGRAVVLYIRPDDELDRLRVEFH